MKLRRKGRRQISAVASLLCALVASLAMAVAPAAAEAPDSAPVRSISEGGFTIAMITGPEAPEEYPILMELGPRQELRQESETRVGIYYKETGVRGFSVESPEAHDAEGATVPTTLEKTGEDEVTMTYRFRAGNPAAGGAPFVYPTTDGPGWSGGWQSFSELIPGELERADKQVIEANPPAPTEPPPTPTCKVPALRGYSLRGAKNRLRAAHCEIGVVHLAAGATAGKGKVVKQFHAAGTELAAGAPVAVKLGAGGSR
jgi:PASTA domain